MNILFIGDIVSKLGRKAVNEFIPKIKREREIDVVIANCENATNGRGISLDHYQDLINSGIDAFTCGEHIFRIKETKEKINDLNIAVPLNFYPSLPGKREITVDTGKKGKLKIVSLLGTVFMDPHVFNPFHRIEKYLQEEVDKEKDTVLVDFHAESTSEKRAMGFFLQDKVNAILGTHTHIQTSDEEILGKKTAYITDVGMCGSTNSVIGVKKEIILKRFNKGEKDRFEWEKEGEYVFNAVIVSIDRQKKITKNIDRISYKAR